MRWSTSTSERCQHLLDNIQFIHQLSYLTLSWVVSALSWGCLSLNIFLYDRLDGQWLLARSGPRDPNNQDTMTCSHILDCSFWEIINLISIGSTCKSNLQPQIQIKFWVGRKIIFVSLMQLGIICLLKKKNQQI